MPDYRVGVHLALTGNMAEKLAVITAALAGMHSHIAKITTGLQGWNTALIAIGTGLGALAVEKVFMKIANSATPLLDAQDKLVRSGFKMNEVLQIQKTFYEDISKRIPTADAAKFLETVKEVRPIFGKDAPMTEIMATAEKAVMVDTLLANMTGRHVGKGELGEYYKLLRSAEMKGIATQPEKRELFMDEAFKYIMAFGGKLSAADYQTMARRGGAAWMHMDVGKAMGPLSVLAADVGGQGAGQALMSLYQYQSGAARLSFQQMDILRRAGLIDPANVIKRAGGFTMKPGTAMTGAFDYQEDLPGWIKNVVSPKIHQLAKQMSEQGLGTEPQLYENLMMRAMPNRNVARLGMMFSDPGFLDQILKDMGLADLVPAVREAYERYRTKNPVGVKEAFTKQWESMWETIGEPFMKAAMPIMTSLTEVFRQVGAWANANPETITKIADALAVFGIALASISVTALASFLGIPGIILAIGGALLSFDESVRKAWTGLKDAVAAGDPNQIIDAGLKFSGAIVAAMVKGLDSAVAGITPTVRAIWDRLASAVVESVSSLYDRIDRFMHPTDAFHRTHPYFNRYDHNVPDLGWGTPPPMITTPPGMNQRTLFTPGGGGPGMMLASAGGNYVPSGGARSAQVNNVVYLDGQAIARAVNDYNISSLEHPTQAPYFDGRESPTTPGHQSISS